MNFKNILKISAILIGIGAISTPLIYQKQINKTIEIAKKELKQNSILIQEKENKDSYIKLNREYILTIQDSTYLIKQLYPDIDPFTLKDLKALLDNSKILVTLNLTKYPIYHKNAITLTLISLNKTLTNELKSEKTGLELLNFIKNRGLEAFIDINNLQISQAKLKDINLKLTNNNNFLNFISSNAIMTFDNQKTTTHISKLKFELQENDYTLLDITNINHKIDYKNNFNYKTSLKIDNINFANKIYSINRNINLKNLNIKSDISPTLDRVNILNNLSLEKINISEKSKYSNNTINLDNFKFNIKLEKIDLNSFNSLQTALETQNYSNIEKPLQTILNKGFSIKINPLSLKHATLKIDSKNINISKISINFNTAIKSNKVDINDFNSILKYTNMDLNILTTKENISLLTQFIPVSAVYLQNIMVEKNNNVMINLSYKNNKLLSNGKQLF